MPETNFARWHQHIERMRGRTVTLQETADMLQLSRSQVINYKRGASRTSGQPAAPDYATRVLMRLIAEGKTPNPWPE